MTYTSGTSNERPQQSVEKSAGFASWSLKEQAECQKKMAVSLENIDSSLRRICSLCQSTFGPQKKAMESQQAKTQETDEIPF